MMEPESNEFQSPVKINAGRKALAHIPVELAAMGAERPLLITTKALGQARGNPHRLCGWIEGFARAPWGFMMPLGNRHN